MEAMKLLFLLLPAFQSLVQAEEAENLCNIPNSEPSEEENCPEVCMAKSPDPICELDENAKHCVCAPGFIFQTTEYKNCITEEECRDLRSQLPFAIQPRKINKPRPIFRPPIRHPFSIPRPPQIPIPRPPKYPFFPFPRGR
ncbi:uncharacterized protein PAF06_016763 [Gastrophryne carolinensis]